MVRVNWSKAAIADLDAIRFYIAQFNSDAADRMIERLKTAGDSLAEFPQRGRPRGAFRELVPHRNYNIRYLVEGLDVLILRVRHVARRTGGS